MMSPPRMSRSSMVGLLGVVGSISVRRTDSSGVDACQRGLESALAMRRSLDDVRPLVSLDASAVSTQEGVTEGVLLAKELSLLVRLAGVEPATLGLEVRCSIQLSYRRPDTPYTGRVSRPDARYVLIGATGQLGFDLARTFDLPGTLLTPRRAELDLLDARRTGGRRRAPRPTPAINTAARNAVGAAGNEPRRAFALDAEAGGTLARPRPAPRAARRPLSTH